MKYFIQCITVNGAHISYDDVKHNNEMLTFPSQNHARAKCMDLIKVNEEDDVLTGTIKDNVYWIHQDGVTISYEIRPLLNFNMVNDFVDKRGRNWECFVDVSYYDMVCVRWKEDKTFNSQSSFHFSTSNEAGLFIMLLMEAS